MPINIPRGDELCRIQRAPSDADVALLGELGPHCWNAANPHNETGPCPENLIDIAQASCDHEGSIVEAQLMNWQKFFIAFIAAFVFLFVFGFLWYGTLMQGAHHEVPSLLRPESDFKSYFGWLILGHIVMAFFFTLLCARYVATGGAGAGAKLGILVGLVYAGPRLISFAVQPLTVKILAGWIMGAVIQFAIAGAIVGAIYKPAAVNIMFVKERSH